MIITIDGLAMKKKEDFYQNIKEELDVPEYFGNNLDALYDFLTEQPDILQMKFLHYNIHQKSYYIYVLLFFSPKKFFITTECARSSELHSVKNC